MTVINPPERKLAKRTSVHWTGLDSPLIKTLEREDLILMEKMSKKCSTFVQQNYLLQNQYFKRHIKPISINQSFESIRTYFVCAQFEAWTGQNQSIIPNLVVSFNLEPDQYFILGPDKICPKIQNLLVTLPTYKVIQWPE